MQSLFVRYKTVDGSRWYPALRGKTLSQADVQKRVDELKGAQWEILETHVDDDGLSVAEDERRYREMCRAERRRGA